MNSELITDKCKEIFAEQCKNLLEVVELFNDYFGQDLVDLTTPYGLNVYSFIDDVKGTSFVDFLHYLEPGEQTLLRNNVDLTDEIWNEHKYAFLDELPFDITPYEGFKRFVCTYLPAHFTILVKFPHVTVKNEKGYTIDIDDLFAKTFIGKDGVMERRFKLSRTTFTKAEWLSNYLHSHVSFYNSTWENLKEFYDPCLGSGPISSTQNRLMEGYDYDIWGLFVFELSKYVTIESLEGVPYRHMSMITLTSGNALIYNPTTRRADTAYHNLSKRNDMLRMIIMIFLKKYPIKLKYEDGVYEIANSYKEMWVAFSNIYTKYGTRLHNLTSLAYSKNSYSVIGDQIYTMQTERMIPDNLEGTPLFMFKGEMQTLHIKREKTRMQEYHLVSKPVIDSIITLLTTLINVNYGKQESIPYKEFCI